jgi:hypothetical protein
MANAGRPEFLRSTGDASARVAAPRRGGADRALVYWRIEPTTPTLADGTWLAFVTAATIGYGDVVPTSPAARAFTPLVLLLGFDVLSLVTGRARGNLGRGARAPDRTRDPARRAPPDRRALKSPLLHFRAGESVSAAFHFTSSSSISAPILFTAESFSSCPTRSSTVLIVSFR